MSQAGVSESTQSVRPVPVQLCLLSGPQAASLLPILDVRTRPEQVLVLAAAGAETVLQAFGQLVQTETGLRVQSRLLGGPVDAAGIEAALETLLTGYAVADVVLNVSGGTRLMGLVAQRLGQRRGIPVWFVDARDGCLQVLNDNSSPFQGRALMPLTVAQALALQGWQCQVQPAFMSAPVWQVLVREWVANLRHYSSGLAILDWLALSVGSGLTSRELQPWQFEVQAFRDVIQRLRQLNMVQLEGRRMVFADEHSLHFARGGWLQGYVLSCLDALGIGPEQRGVQVQACDGRGLQHELDVVFVAANQLHVIGCRSATVRKGSPAKGMEVVFSSNVLQDCLPLTAGKALLLAYSPLKNLEVSRLRVAGVSVLQEKQLQNLATWLREWLVHQV
ncbi:MAG TPA: DUF1887 family CARF protein [Thiolinea sp.]|nr:DUF1887 family CARF protein [Thiolinea sp.]